MALTALICDDEAPAREELRFLLAEAGGVSVTGEADSAVEALRLITAGSFDVVFLDIEMPGLSGMQLASVLAHVERPPAVVFVTGYAEHAVEAFEVSAADYLLKPVGLLRLRQALGRVERVPGEEAPLTRLPVEKAGKKVLVPVEDVDYATAEGDYSYLTVGHERYLSTMSLSELEAKLAPAGFFRIHRRYLVDLAKVREVVPMYGGTLLLTLSDERGTQLPVSRRRVPSLRKALGL